MLGDLSESLEVVAPSGNQAVNWMCFSVWTQIPRSSTNCADNLKSPKTENF
jgi:hypothetical protein